MLYSELESELDIRHNIDEFYLLLLLQVNIENVFLKANVGKRQGGGLSMVQSIITGAIAGAVTCVGSNPFWVANTRMMTDKNRGIGRRERGSTGSTFKAIVNIIENDRGEHLVRRCVTSVSVSDEPDHPVHHFRANQEHHYCQERYRVLHCGRTPS